MSTRRLLIGLVLVGCVFLLIGHADPSYSKVPTAPQLTAASDITPTVSAKAWGVFAVSDGSLLYSENADESLPIASVTKLLTAGMVRSQYNLSATTTITAADVATEGRAGSLKAGDVLPVSVLLFPLLLESSNDAAAALEHVEDGSLVTHMNYLATLQGWHATSYADASGLSSDNVSSVRDLARITAYLYKRQPHLFDVTNHKEFLYEDFGWHNNSPFITMEGYHGGKHGYTPEAGKTATVVFNETIDGLTVQVGYVLLGSSDLVADITALRAAVQGGLMVE